MRTGAHTHTHDWWERHKVLLKFNGIEHLGFNILNQDLDSSTISGSPPGWGWIYCSAPETFTKAEVPRWIGQFSQVIFVKPTLNLDLVSHSVATWVRWKISMTFYRFLSFIIWELPCVLWEVGGMVSHCSLHCLEYVIIFPLNWLSRESEETCLSCHLIYSITRENRGAHFF